MMDCFYVELLLTFVFIVNYSMGILICCKFTSSVEIVDYSLFKNRRIIFFDHQLY